MPFLIMFKCFFLKLKIMKNTVIIKKNFEFKYFLKKGTYTPGNLLDVFILEKEKNKRLGIAVSKKSGGSVQRNQIKRYIRAAYTDIEDKINSEVGLLIIWKKNNEYDKASYSAIKEDLEKILRKKGIIN